MKTNRTIQNSCNITDLDIEKSVLGTILSEKSALDQIREIISRDCFSTQLHQDVYDAVISLSNKGEPIDILTAVTEMNRLGTADNMTPYNVTSLSGCWTPYYYNNALILAEFRSRNKAWELGQQLSIKARDMTYDLGDTLEEINSGMADVFNIPTNGISDMRQAAEALYKDHIDKNLCTEATLTGAPTGFREFDSRSGGLQKGNFVIIAGETSQGKTSFATTMLMNAARAGYPVAFYSMEMTATELFARMTACETGISANRYLYGQLDARELALFDNSLSRLIDLPVYFDDHSTSNIDVIISSIRAMAIRKKIKGAVIDYLQILNVNMKGINKEQQMGDVSRRLKNLAKDLGIWIIALSQLRRDEHSHVPSLNRLRDSGQIAEAADTVILLYRPEVYNQIYPEPFKTASTSGTAMVDVAKGRNIGLMKFIVGFEPSVTRFYELEQVPIRVTDEDCPF